MASDATRIKEGSIGIGTAGTLGSALTTILTYFLQNELLVGAISIMICTVVLAPLGGYLSLV